MIRKGYWGLLLILALLPGSAVSETPPVDPSPAHTAWIELQEILEQAPSRQVGQPGNQWVDEWVRQRFSEAVDRSNEALAHGEFEQLLDTSRAAEADWLAAWDESMFERRPDLDRDREMRRAFSTVLILRLATDRPKVPAGFLISLLILLMGAWWFQRRKSLLYASAVVVVLLLAVPVVATIAQSRGETHTDTDHDVDPDLGEMSELAAQLMEASRAAAGSAEGLWQHGRITFPSAAFLPGEGTLHGPNGGMRVYQMAPNLVEPGNLPGLAFSGPLVYLGKGTPADFEQSDLEGALAVMEFASDDLWIHAVELGAEGVVFLQPPPESGMLRPQADRKITLSPVTVPRWYAPRNEFLQTFGVDTPDALRQGGEGELRQEPGRWERVELANDWLFIPAREEIRQASPDIGRELVHIQAAKDSASIVPELAPGAGGAANLVAVMRLVDYLEQNPPPRPVLISVVNDQTNMLHGGLQFSSMAFADVDAYLEEAERLTRLLAQAEFTSYVFSRSVDESLIAYLRTAIERIGGRSFTIKSPAVDYLMMMRNNLRETQGILEVRASQLQLLEGGEEISEEEERELLETREKISMLEAEAEHYVQLLGLFNRFGHRTEFSELSAEDLVALEELFEVVAGQAEMEAELLRSDRQQILDNLSLRTRLLALHAEAVEPRGIEILSNRNLFEDRFPAVPGLAAFCLDLQFGSDSLGFFSFDATIFHLMPGHHSGQRIGRLVRFLNETISENIEKGILPEVYQPTRGAGVPSRTFEGLSLANPSYTFHQSAIAGLTLSSTIDPRLHAFTPDDTLEKIDYERFENFFTFTERLLPLVIESPDLAWTRQTRGSSADYSLEITVRQMDRFSVELPKTIVPGALLVGLTDIRDQEAYPRTYGEVRPYPILMADNSGRLTLRGHYWRRSSVQVFGYNEDYTELRAALDLESSERRFRSTFEVGDRNFYGYRSVVTFDARKIDLIGLRQPLTLSAVDRLDVLDGRSDTTPQHYGVAGVRPARAKQMPLALDGTASVFTEPHVPVKLEIRDAPVIRTTPEDLDGLGFQPDTGLIRGLTRIGATDMWRLAEDRLGVLASRGVVSDSAEEFAREAGQYLTIAEEEAGEASARLRLSEVARGLAFRAYTQATNLTADLIHAVVLLLALVVPFCFFLMKLLTPYTDFNKQLGIFGGIFALMVLALYFIQPAFHVGERPEVVIPGFVILGMAVFVASVVISRFNASMTQAIEESQAADDPDTPQGRLAGVAFMVGVNNMRRRRIRTTLTCATIVLVTFTILSVISIGHDAEPLRLRLPGQATQNGVLFTSPGMAPIDSVQMQRLADHFGAEGETLERTWTYRQDIGTGSYLPYFVRPAEPNPDARMEELSALVLLGLESSEDGFLGNLTEEPWMVDGSRWFSSNDANEIILSRQAAALLGIQPFDFEGREILFMGQRLRLVGLINDDAFPDFEDLRGTSLLPLLVDPSAELASEDLATAAVDLADLPGVRQARPIDVILLPIDNARNLEGTTFRTLSVKYLPRPGESLAEAAARCWQDVTRFLRYQDAYLTVSLAEPVEREEGRGIIDRGQYAMASGGGAAVGGVLKVLIPVILAATIILNTMLGSVMERNREIAIYNAIGLNPSHVMVFFLAEALVFGLVGSVAGYFIGQFLSVLLSPFIDINLNYSSLAVMVTIVMTIGTVLLSTLYPAMMAARAAVPSGQRRWSLPRPEGDEIHLRFPFSYDPRRILGVCSWLNDFMEQNSEASTGKFLAHARAFGRVPSETGETTSEQDHRPLAYVMVYDVAPPPFDLGVNQKMEVYADYDPVVKAHMLSVHLTRLTGDYGSWLTVNQTFLELLRKRLLSWRSQKPETQSNYFGKGEKLFHDAPVLPTTDSVATR